VEEEQSMARKRMISCPLQAESGYDTSRNIGVKVCASCAHSAAVAKVWRQLRRNCRQVAKSLHSSVRNCRKVGNYNPQLGGGARELDPK